MTLRRQIATAVAAISVLVAVAVGLLVHQAMVRQHVDQARGSALTALDAALGAYERNEELTGGGPRQAALDDPALPARLRTLAAEGRRGSLLARGGPEGESVWAAVAVRGGGEVLSVRVGFAQDRQAIADLDRIILIAVVASVFITVLAGVLVADRISRRLRTAAAAARGIADGRTDTRIGELVDGRDEVADLAAAVDLMSRELHRRLEDEQRFTADVAHELRTPLTGLVTAAELLPPGRPTQLVQNRVQALRALVEDLLEVSRLDADAETPDLAAVPLDRAVRRTVTLTGLDVDVEVRADASVRTDLRRLDRILGNLLLNADRHGGGTIALHVDGHRITVRDHGPGFPDELLRDGPQRFRTSVRERGRGHGLGLTIAQGHTRVIGATLTFTNHPTGGAVATLVLPAAPDPADNPLH
ncbi:HAMP domain-containing sensor histidine kinase [Kitasatospora purpeofusca]|uniref:sensor histidine kinase n=1 Tax=Kitasatospora purpeofusca TaxID=67352 RepID=UPI002A5A35E6|nr:HAMP domain-containing sensor histidine kinase [Kitasatospora purpeofusca]MDY0816398.1 HAMP domain-containing sensor histidine kinase [Kitasatospora purpeofusca]